MPYEPPHPQKGTPYHRYVTLLLPQLERLNLTPADLPSGRAGFDVREFAAKHKLGYYTEGEGVSMEMVPETYKEKVGKGMGGGLHMWRAVWDQDVSRVYKDILSESALPRSPDAVLDANQVLMFRATGAHVRFPTKAGSLRKPKDPQVYLDRSPYLHICTSSEDG